MLFYLLAFILLLGPLVFVHEFGHFLFAKLFKVRVDTFSMGFGPKLVHKKYRETDYCLSAVPLGGYVKLYGQDPGEAVELELKDRALCNLDAWKRFLIFVAGPLFNFLFAVLVFAIMLILGEHHRLPVLERVPKGTQAYVAGFRSGDLITAVDRQVVSKFDEVARVVSASPGKPLVFRIKRATDRAVKAERPKEITVTPTAAPGLSIYGEAVEAGEIEGLLTPGRYTTAGVSDPASAAARAGLKTGDEILRVNGVRVRSWEELETVVEKEIARKSKELVLGIVPHVPAYWSPESLPAAVAEPAAQVTLPAKSPDALGLRSSELFVSALKKGSPAEAAGVVPGDRLIAVDDAVLRSFPELRDLVQKAGESAGRFELALERQGQRLRKEIAPVGETVRDPGGNESKQYLMGVYPLFVQSEPETFVERIFNPFTLTLESWSRAFDLSGKTLVSIKKLVFRQVSVGTLGGPILIGKLAGDSMSHGIAAFLKVMALISISLAIFNILPVPILDGGHIFLLLVEVARGKPITMRQTEVVQQVGLSLIVLLLVVVLYNDFSRVGIPALGHIFR